MAYKVRIDTSAYKDRKCSQKNWEPGTLNDFMHAINGWSIRENNLRELNWRISYLGSWAPYQGVPQSNAYFEFTSFENDNL